MGISLKGSSQSYKRKRKAPTKADILANVERYTDELAFIEKYLAIRGSGFLQSLEQQIKQGRILTEKQKDALDGIIKSTDFEHLARRNEVDVLRFSEMMQIFEVLDRVSFGQYPSEAYHSIKRQFAFSGSVSDKQLGLLKKLQHRFRRQIAKL